MVTNGSHDHDHGTSVGALFVVSHRGHGAASGLDDQTKDIAADKDDGVGPGVEAAVLRTESFDDLSKEDVVSGCQHSRGDDPEESASALPGGEAATQTAKNEQSGNLHAAGVMGSVLWLFRSQSSVKHTGKHRRWNTSSRRTLHAIPCSRQTTAGHPSR